MKNKLAFLGLVVGLMVPLAAKADPESFRTGAALAKGKARPQRTVIYVTDKKVTGTHLPMVVRRYNGQYESMAPTSAYGRPDLDRTGHLSVGGELIVRDPALSSAHTNFARR